MGKQAKLHTHRIKIHPTPNAVIDLDPGKFLNVKYMDEYLKSKLGDKSFIVQYDSLFAVLVDLASEIGKSSNPIMYSLFEFVKLKIDMLVEKENNPYYAIKKFLDLSLIYLDENLRFTILEDSLGYQFAKRLCEEAKKYLKEHPSLQKQEALYSQFFEFIEGFYEVCETIAPSINYYLNQQKQNSTKMINNQTSERHPIEYFTNKWKNDPRFAKTLLIHTYQIYQKTFPQKKFGEFCDLIIKNKSDYQGKFITLFQTCVEFYKKILFEIQGMIREYLASLYKTQRQIHYIFKYPESSEAINVMTFYGYYKDISRDIYIESKQERVRANKSVSDAPKKENYQNIIIQKRMKESINIFLKFQKTHTAAIERNATYKKRYAFYKKMFLKMLHREENFLNNYFYENHQKKISERLQDFFTSEQHEAYMSAYKFFKTDQFQEALDVFLEIKKMREGEKDNLGIIILYYRIYQCYRAMIEIEEIENKKSYDMLIIVAWEKTSKAFKKSICEKLKDGIQYLTDDNAKNEWLAWLEIASTEDLHLLYKEKRKQKQQSMQESYQKINVNQDKNPLVKNNDIFLPEDSNQSYSLYFSYPICKLIHFLLNINGCKVIGVGGIIRAEELGLDTDDVDLIVTIPLDQLKQLLLASREELNLKNLKLINPNHPILQLETYSGEKIEISLLMSLKQNNENKKRIVLDDGFTIFYTPSEPENLLKDLLEDARQRDFKMNALFVQFTLFDLKQLDTNTSYHMLHGKLFDLVEGLKDLGKREIDTIIAADDYFKKDPIGMLRAIRFNANTNCQINENVLEAIKNNKALLQSFPFSNERKCLELTKILNGNNLRTVMNTMQELDVLKFLFPDASVILKATLSISRSMINLLLDHLDNPYTRNHFQGLPLFLAVMLWHPVGVQISYQRSHTFNLEKIQTTINAVFERCRKNISLSDEMRLQVELIWQHFLLRKFNLNYGSIAKHNVSVLDFVIRENFIYLWEKADQMVMSQFKFYKSRMEGEEKELLSIQDEYANDCKMRCNT